MTRLGQTVVTLCLSCLFGCSSRNLDLDQAAPASSVPTSSAPSGVPSEESSGVWVDDQRLYWRSSFASLRSCFKADCEHTIQTYMTPDGPIAAHMASPDVGDGHVYWTSWTSTLFSCPVAGCAPKPVTVVQDPGLRDSLFAHAGYVYWTSDLDIYRCAASGCGTTPEVVASGAGADHLVFDEQRAYWLGEPSVFSAPVDGSEPARVENSVWAGAEIPDGADIPARSLGLAVGGGYLYWATGRQVFRCPTASCNAAAPTLLATADAQITELKVDDSGMYWLEADAIHFCPLTGCEQSVALTPATVAQLDTWRESARFALDAHDVYWLEQEHQPTARSPLGNGLIRKTAK